VSFINEEMKMKECLSEAKNIILFKEAFFMIIKNKNSEAVERKFCYFFKSKEEKEIFNSGAKRKY